MTVNNGNGSCDDRINRYRIILRNVIFNCDRIKVISINYYLARHKINKCIILANRKKKKLYVRARGIKTKTKIDFFKPELE